MRLWWASNQFRMHVLLLSIVAHKTAFTLDCDGKFHRTVTKYSNANFIMEYLLNGKLVPHENSMPQYAWDLRSITYMVSRLRAHLNIYIPECYWVIFSYTPNIVSKWTTCGIRFNRNPNYNWSVRLRVCNCQHLPLFQQWTNSMWSLFFISIWSICNTLKIKLWWHRTVGSGQ